MKINIKTTNLELGEEDLTSVEEYAYRKISELQKLVKNEAPNNSNKVENGQEPVEVWVELARTTKAQRKGNVYKAEVQMKLPHTRNDLRVDVVKHDIREAIDEARKEMEVQVKKHKGKRRDRFEKSMRAAKRLTNISPLARFRKEK